MSETARERFHRVQRETAGGEGVDTTAAARPVLGGGPAPLPAAEQDRIDRSLDASHLAWRLRRATLAARMGRLGVSVTEAELPGDASDLEHLEQQCALAESAGEAK